MERISCQLTIPSPEESNDALDRVNIIRKTRQINAPHKCRRFLGLSEAIVDPNIDNLEKFVTGGYIEEENHE